MKYWRFNQEWSIICVDTVHYFSHLVLCVACVYVCNKYWTRQRVVPTLSFGKRKARIVSPLSLDRDWLISTDKGGQTNTLLIRSEPPPCGFSFKSLPSKLIIGKMTQLNWVFFKYGIWIIIIIYSSDIYFCTCILNIMIYECIIFLSIQKP